MSIYLAEFVGAFLGGSIYKILYENDFHIKYLFILFIAFIILILAALKGIQSKKTK